MQIVFSRYVPKEGVKMGAIAGVPGWQFQIVGNAE
jgi:hypothetical protein